MTNCITENALPLDKFWKELRKAAEKIAQNEPMTASMLHARILTHSSFMESLAQLLAFQLGHDGSMEAVELEKLFLDVMKTHPSIARDASIDVQAVVFRDPAMNDLCEPFLLSKGFHALQVFRVAHVLWHKDRKFLAQLLQSAASRVFAVDIHPAAKIGHGILIDHATNVVVGETSKIGNNVSILHGVTLGGTGKESGDRHPKIGDGVLLSAHAQLLGNIRIGKGAKIGAGAVVLENVPPHTTFAGVPAVKVGVPDCAQPALEMRAEFVDNPASGS